MFNSILWMRERNEEFMANGKEYDVMGYWDCPVCQTKKIKGTVRDCPNCGAPRGKDVRFYMDGEDVRLTEEEEKK